jgi:integrase
MGAYKRGNRYWYKFRFLGQVVRESAHTTSKTVAEAAERSRRRELELAYNGIPKRIRMPLLKIAAQEWLATKQNLSAKSISGYKERIQPILNRFGSRLVSDITEKDVHQYQLNRLGEGVGPRTVNYETGCLRGVLKMYGIWGPIADRVHSLRERREVGRAISHEDEKKLLRVTKASRSLALYPLFVLSVDTGIRASEARSLHRDDIHLDENAQGNFLVVPKSKTEAGRGRLIPLTVRAAAAIRAWYKRFPDAASDSFVFPRHRIGIHETEQAAVYEVDLYRPMKEWKTAWYTACRKAGVRYRWHDLRHTFISRLAENPQVSEQTIRELAGHVSKEMLQRYSHIRTDAKVQAIQALAANH